MRDIIKIDYENSGGISLCDKEWYMCWKDKKAIKYKNVKIYNAYTLIRGQS